jgi:hypothetical protein
MQLGMLKCFLVCRNKAPVSEDMGRKEYEGKREKEKKE